MIRAAMDGADLLARHDPIRQVTRKRAVFELWVTGVVFAERFRRRFSVRADVRAWGRFCHGHVLVHGGPIERQSLRNPRLGPALRMQDACLNSRSLPWMSVTPLRCVALSG